MEETFDFEEIINEMQDVADKISAEFNTKNKEKERFYQYRLRNIPPKIWEMLKDEQKKLNEKGYFHSIEKVIYILLKKSHQ
ncbi:hypothetical protein TRIP_D440220 [uncultured Paludibacter sp.]|nr:hypothetical protein TRIP_D440220 [uncultured Paludibacter sp.]